MATSSAWLQERDLGLARLVVLIGRPDGKFDPQPLMALARDHQVTRSLSLQLGGRAAELADCVRDAPEPCRPLLASALTSGSAVERLHRLLDHHVKRHHHGTTLAPRTRDQSTSVASAIRARI